MDVLFYEGGQEDRDRWRGSEKGLELYSEEGSSESSH